MWELQFIADIQKRHLHVKSELLAAWEKQKWFSDGDGGAGAKKKVFYYIYLPPSGKFISLVKQAVVECGA